jgi:hypothetical protein
MDLHRDQSGSRHRQYIEIIDVQLERKVLSNRGECNDHPALMAKLNNGALRS